jgi:arylsulfatase
VTGTTIEGLNGASSSIEYMSQHLHEMGGRRSFDGYPVGWAWAMATPFQYTKQVASHFGGTRDGLVVSWPKRIRDVGGLRSVPTRHRHRADDLRTRRRYAASLVGGVEQMSFDGVSFAGRLDDAEAPRAHRSQYFEMLGNHAYYEDGWIASTTPGACRGAGAPRPIRMPSAGSSTTCRAISPRPMTSQGLLPSGSRA